MGPKREPLLIPFAILTGLDLMFAGAALGDVIGVKTLGLLVLGTKAVNAGLTYYTRGQVTPVADPRDGDGRPLRALHNGGYLSPPTPLDARRASQQIVSPPSQEDEGADDEEPEPDATWLADRTGLKVRREGSNDYTARAEGSGEVLGTGRSAGLAIVEANRVRLARGTHPRS